MPRSLPRCYDQLLGQDLSGVGEGEVGGERQEGANGGHDKLQGQEQQVQLEGDLVGGAGGWDGGGAVSGGLA